MNPQLTEEIKKLMSPLLKAKVNRVAKDKKISLGEAIIFLLEEGFKAASRD